MAGRQHASINKGFTPVGLSQGPCLAGVSEQAGLSAALTVPEGKPVAGGYLRAHGVATSLGRILGASGAASALTARPRTRAAPRTRVRFPAWRRILAYYELITNYINVV